ncbi:hypothetical protein M2103_001969 [Ereboglobus sp. PH5-5]|nr:hypothetical protein [Ereboglobus sp. PH5-5]
MVGLLTMPQNSPRIAVIACSVLEDEVGHFARGLPHVKVIEYLPQLLHNEPVRLRAELQAAVARCEANPAVDAIVLAYGLCSRGVEGLRHARCPLVIARAHDCVTLYLGSKERYSEYLKKHPGTYWYSPGWIKAHAPPGPDRDAYLREEYAKQFEPEDVEYLVEQERLWTAHYDRAAYIGLGAGEKPEQVEYTKQCAACLGWVFDHVRGDESLMRDLFAGPDKWDAKRFLIVPPNHGIQLTADDSVIKAVPLEESK